MKKLARKVDLVPENVERAARPKSSPIHHHFCWDEKKGAHQYRLIQARMLLVSIAQKDPRDPKAKPIRAFINETRRGSRASQPYVSISKVMGSAERRDKFVRLALEELHAWMDRYGQLKELADYFAAIKGVDKGRKTARKSRAAGC